MKKDIETIDTAKLANVTGGCGACGGGNCGGATRSGQGGGEQEGSTTGRPTQTRGSGM